MFEKKSITRSRRFFDLVGFSALLLWAALPAAADAEGPAHFFNPDQLLNSRIVQPSEITARSPRAVTSVVTDMNPRAILPLTERKITDPSVPTGPFNAHATVMLHILSVYDQRSVGHGSFEQITRFILPDGSLYGTRSVSVTPSLAPVKPTIPRAPNRIGPGSLRRAPSGPAARPAPRVGPIAIERRGPVYTEVLLPVSGTWITRHNLYGEWKVEIQAVRDGEVLAETVESFTIGLD